MGESVCLARSFSQPAEISSRETDEVNPRRVLTESVSFGRFASETLEWEKWSAFTQNRYLEEVERYTKPGSVAEKKAFFEAHFRNRASGKTTKTKTEEANVVKTIDETVCQVRKDNLVDSQVPLVDELRHVEVSTAEVGSVAPSISVTDATTGVQTGEVKDTIAENYDPMAVPEDEDLDKENSTSLTKERRPSSSGSKTCSRSLNTEPSFSVGLDLPLKKTRKEPLSTRKRSTSVSKNQNRSPPQPFHISTNCAPSGNTNKKIDLIPQNGSKCSTNVKDARKADKKERSGPSSVLNFASSPRQTTKAAPKKLARKSTTQETTSSNAGSSIKPKGNEPTVASKSRKRPLPRAAKEDSDAPKCSTRASAFRLPELLPPKSRPSDEKRKNITVGSSVSCRIPNNVQRQPSASCENISSTQSRTRAKSYTVSTPFKFRSDERAEKRKEFFKKLEEKKKKKEQSSCGFKENQNTHLASEEHKNPPLGGFQAPMISLSSPRFRRNQTPGRENIKKSHKSPHKVAPVEITNTRNPSMEKYKRCKIHPSLTRKKSQENSSPNVL